FHCSFHILHSAHISVHTHPSLTPLRPRCILQPSHPVIMLSITIPDLELAQIQPLLRLIERQQIDRERIVLLAERLILTLHEHMTATRATEPTVELGSFRLVAGHFTL